MGVKTVSVPEYISVQRSILYDLKDEIVPPTNETVTQVFARLSAYRDAMDGPQASFLHILLCSRASWLALLFLLSVKSIHEVVESSLSYQMTLLQDEGSPG